MLAKVAAFELRYQLRSPLFIAAWALLFLAAFADMAIYKLLSVGGGNVLFNSPHAIIVSHLLVSLLFLFLGAAFVSNVVVRDDQLGFGAIVRSTRITKADYLFGRFLGSFAVGALVMAAIPLGAWLGTLAPFADQEMIGPNRLSAYAYGYGLFALPNALIISAILFALATSTRSTAGTFIGVVGLLILYLVCQGMLEGMPHLREVRMFADPFGMSAYMAGSRYFTAAELNSGLVPVSARMIQSRLLWVGISLALLAITYRLFQFADRGPSRRQIRRRKALQSTPAPGPRAPFASLAEPRFGFRTAVAQFMARTGMEARFIGRSPAFLILLLIAFAFTLPGLLTASGWMDVALYPLTFISVPIIEDSFGTLLVIIATYYGGELVWRERERNVHEIIDATPLPTWALMLPKMLGLALVLVATLLVGMAVGLLVQAIDGAVEMAPGDYLAWYLLPGMVDALLIAVLAVFVSALSPSKYAGWGIMLLYLVLLFLGPSLGVEHPLLLYGNVPAAPLSDMAGTGNFSAAAWWFRAFWAAVAILLLVAVQLLWRRGTQQALMPRLRQIPAQLRTGTGAVAALALAVLALSGAWIVYNSLILNDFRTSWESERYLAEYEKRFFRYARLPQPTVRHVDLDVALFPAEVRATVSGRYRIVNETARPIEQVHVRLMNSGLALVAVDFPGAQLALNDEDFDYRIYRLDSPMKPGETRSFSFRALREQLGFRAGGTEIGVLPNGSDLDTLELTPRIGMSDIGLIGEPATRRRHGLPKRRPFPKLNDLAATRLQPNGDVSWTTADIRVSTSADQIPIAPGRKVSEYVRGGRRSARFVSATPIKNYFSIQSARFAVKRARHRGVEHAIYYHPAHHWNVDRMMRAMHASIDYYSEAFGPYQFDQARIVETPAYRQGGQAFANTIPLSETAAFAMDLRDPQSLDMASMVTAHELAHQWWGHQVVGARMQGAGLLTETLAQYSALMVMKRLHGEEGIRPFLQFQRDRYLSGRRTQVLGEEPLASVEISQQHIAYGKGALAMYLLQQRIGEEAVNRALRRFVARYRFTVAPYPRSLDLIGMLRAEAKPADQALITDLFERITLYDLSVGQPTATRRADGRWDVTVPVQARKAYADSRGKERQATLDETVEIALFLADPRGGSVGRGTLIKMEQHRLRAGRQSVRFVTDRRPAFAGVDPNSLFIERNVDDNIAAVTG